LPIQYTQAKSLSVNDFTGSILTADRVNYLNKQQQQQQLKRDVKPATRSLSTAINNNNNNNNNNNIQHQNTTNRIPIIFNAQRSSSQAVTLDHEPATIEDLNLSPPNSYLRKKQINNTNNPPKTTTTTTTTPLEEINKILNQQLIDEIPISIHLKNTLMENRSSSSSSSSNYRKPANVQSQFSKIKPQVRHRYSTDSTYGEIEVPVVFDDPIIVKLGAKSHQQLSTDLSTEIIDTLGNNNSLPVVYNRGEEESIISPIVVVSRDHHYINRRSGKQKPFISECQAEEVKELNYCNLSLSYIDETLNSSSGPLSPEITKPPPPPVKQKRHSSIKRSCESIETSLAKECVLEVNTMVRSSNQSVTETSSTSSSSSKSQIQRNKERRDRRQRHTLPLVEAPPAQTPVLPGSPPDSSSSSPLSSSSSSDEELTRKNLKHKSCSLRRLTTTTKPALVITSNSGTKLPIEKEIKVELVHNKVLEWKYENQKVITADKSSGYYREQKEEEEEEEEDANNTTLINKDQYDDDDDEPNEANELDDDDSTDLSMFKPDFKPDMIESKPVKHKLSLLLSNSSVKSDSEAAADTNNRHHRYSNGSGGGGSSDMSYIRSLRHHKTSGANNKHESTDTLDSASSYEIRFERNPRDEQLIREKLDEKNTLWNISKAAAAVAVAPPPPPIIDIDIDILCLVK
jgi:hypothetical protein